MPIVSPRFATGREIWRLGFPRTITPDHKTLIRGYVSPIVFTGTGSGLVSIFKGAPTDTFAITLQFPVGGAPGTATIQTQLQTTEAFAPAELTPPVDPDLGYAVYDIRESGLTVQLSGTFAAGDSYSFTTTESTAQAQQSTAIGGKIARALRTRLGNASMPIEQYGDDIKSIEARMVAYELLRVGGFDPKKGHDLLVMEGNRAAKRDLVRIAEEIEESDLPGQGVIPGVECRSQEPQGVELW